MPDSKTTSGERLFNLRNSTALMFLICILFSPQLTLAMQTCGAQISGAAETSIAPFTPLSHSQPNYIRLPFATKKTNGNAVVVSADHTVTLSAIQAKKYDALLTHGLMSCVAFIAKDISTGTILLSHFFTASHDSQQSVRTYLHTLESEMNAKGGSLINSDVTLAWGQVSRSEYSEVVETLVSLLGGFSPNLVKLDSTIIATPSTSKFDRMSVYVDLETGEIFKKNTAGGEPGVISDFKHKQGNHQQTFNQRTRFKKSDGAGSVL